MFDGEKEEGEEMDLRKTEVLDVCVLAVVLAVTSRATRDRGVFDAVSQIRNRAPTL